MIDSHVPSLRKSGIRLGLTPLGEQIENHLDFLGFATKTSREVIQYLTNSADECAVIERDATTVWHSYCTCQYADTLCSAVQ